MESGTDVVTTLTWGIRRYALLVVAMVVVVGLLVPFALSRRAEVYQATAQVGPSDQLVLPNTNPLPRFADSVFNNGAVEQNVRSLLHQPTGNVIPSKVQLVAAQDNVVLDVVASAPTADQAMQIANEAAQTYVLELNRYSASVAEFQLQHRAVLAKKVPKLAGGYLSVALGLLAGLLAGMALVGMILVIRRPVVESATARGVTGLPVLGRISLPRHGPPDASDNRSLGLLCRRLLGTSASTVHVIATTRGRDEQLAGLMTEVFGRMQVERPPARPDGQGNVSAPPKVVVLDSAQAWLSAPDDDAYTVLVAPEGISTRKLRLFAESHDTGSPRGVVMVARRHGGYKKPKDFPRA